MWWCSAQAESVWWCCAEHQATMPCNRRRICHPRDGHLLPTSRSIGLTADRTTPDADFGSCRSTSPTHRCQIEIFLEVLCYVGGFEYICTTCNRQGRGLEESCEVLMVKAIVSSIHTRSATGVSNYERNAMLKIIAWNPVCRRLIQRSASLRLSRRRTHVAVRCSSHALMMQ